MKIKCGVPQGSILGPILFLIYINDIVNASKLFEIVQFADDICLFLKQKNVKLLNDCANRELTKIGDWLISNALSLNVKKSNFLFFQTNKNDEPPNLQIMGSYVERKEVVKYLGLHIDQRLNWQNQVTQSCRAWVYCTKQSF